MKKFVSLLLAVCMVFGAAVSLAEALNWTDVIPGYEVSITLPEGAESELEQGDEWLWLRIIFAQGKEEKPIYDLTIAPSEECEGKSMADLTQEELDVLIELLADNALEPKYRTVQLEDGNVLVVVEEDTELNDFAAMGTIYNGYFISLYARYEDYAKLSDADIEMMSVIMTEALEVKAI